MPIIGRMNAHMTQRIRNAPILVGLVAVLLLPMPTGAQINNKTAEIDKPLAIDGSLLSIRKFARVPIGLDRLIEIGSVPAQAERGRPASARV